MVAKAQRLSHASRSRAPVTCEQKPMACHMRAQPGTCHMRARPSTCHLSRVQKPFRDILNILLEKTRISIPREMYGCLYVCMCVCICLFCHIDSYLRCFMYISIVVSSCVTIYASRFLEFECTRTNIRICIGLHPWTSLGKTFGKTNHLGNHHPRILKTYLEKTLPTPIVRDPQLCWWLPAMCRPGRRFFWREVSECSNIPKYIYIYSI